MSNVLLTNYCNRNCPYCFAKEKIHSNRYSTPVKDASLPGEYKFMSMEALGKIISFLKKSDTKVISFLGGEPTLHPKFRDMVEFAINEGFDLKVFSNGLMPKETAQFIRDHKANLKVIINLNHPRQQDRTQLEHVHGSLGILNGKAALSCNIYRADMDLQYLIDTILNFKLDRRIRVGIAVPILGEKNAFLARDHYRSVGKKLADFSDKCGEHDIGLGFDCGFTLCMFTHEEIGRMIMNNVDFNIFCKPIIDIGPDLNVWCCFPLSGIANVYLEDFENREELVRFYEKKFGAYKHVGSMPECIECPQIRRQQCFGGCIVHTMKSFNLDKLKKG